jgi:hypothetical protein
MRDDFGIRKIVPVKVALTATQVEELDLPPNRVKEESSRAAKFQERHGSDTYELEALPPEELQEILDETIRGVLDLDAFNREVDAEKADAAKLEALRQSIRGSIETLGCAEG